MREIKFRAWKQSAGRMLDWDAVCRTGELEEILRGAFLNPMQYTGLKDINGVEIYEGDIIRGDDGIHDRVVYEGNKFILQPLGDDCVHWEDCEVIGNIYENPGLLEEKK